MLEDNEQRLIDMIPLFQKKIGVDMSYDIFRKKELLPYYFIEVIKDENNSSEIAVYTFETGSGSAVLKVKDFNSETPRFEYNDVLQSEMRKSGVCFPYPTNR